MLLPENAIAHHHSQRYDLGARMFAVLEIVRVYCMALSYVSITIPVNLHVIRVSSTSQYFSLTSIHNFPCLVSKMTMNRTLCLRLPLLLAILRPVFKTVPIDQMPQHEISLTIIMTNTMYSVVYMYCKISALEVLV